MKTANFTFFVASFVCLTNAAKAADRNLTFGVIAKSNNNPVFQVVRVSAEAEARKLTAEKGSASQDRLADADRGRSTEGGGGYRTARKTLALPALRSAARTQIS